MTDRYQNFSELSADTREGIDYRITLRNRCSDVLVLAPHGGCTEPHTAAVAKAIAGIQHSLYVFEAHARGLHVTSCHFDEPHALALVRRHSTVVTVHGCKDSRSATIDVFVGGLDEVRRDAMIARLHDAGFTATVDRRTKARSPANICNKGRSHAGVQLEITQRLRNRLARHAARDRLRRFARAARQAIISQADRMRIPPDGRKAVEKPSSP